MQLKCIGSSSSGNGYLFISKNETLLVECGIRFSEVKKVLDFDIGNIVGAICSHLHGDHFKYSDQVISAGIDVYASKETLDTLKTKSHRAIQISHGVKFMVGSFTILPFETKHDCPGSLGFLIKHEECGVVLFLTDSFYSEFKFSGLNNILCECNYSDDILNENVRNGNIHPAVAKRVTESHMSLQTTKELLKANDLVHVNNIVLIHLSEANSDAKRFQKEIQELTMCETTVATKNLTIQFNKTAF